jgi:protein-L-isoaspartate(D-aspartate) O-methyltransferase
MAEIPREEFLPPEVKASAYEDRALPIGWNQTMSQPLVVAMMTQALKLSSEQNVLDIGTGSGYQAAVLGRLSKRVVSIEREPDLAERAAATLSRLSFGNVQVIIADGREGWPREAPYDAILVAAAAERVPEPLIEQLAEGGRMVIPVEVLGADYQDLRLLRKQSGTLLTDILFPVRFVPLLRGLRLGSL